MAYRFLEFQPASKLNLFSLKNNELVVFCYKPLLDATVNFFYETCDSLMPT